MDMKLTDKGRLLLSFLFFGGIGIVAVYLAVDIFITGTGIRGQDILLHEYENPIIKYIVAYLFLAFAIPSLAMPFLQYMGVVPVNYHSASKYLKAKHNVIFQTLLIPAALMMLLMFYADGCHSGLDCKKAILAGVGFVVFYAYNIFVLRKERSIHMPGGDI